MRAEDPESPTALGWPGSRARRRAAIAGARAISHTVKPYSCFFKVDTAVRPIDKNGRETAVRFRLYIYLGESDGTALIHSVDFIAILNCRRTVWPRCWGARADPVRIIGLSSKNA